MTGEQSTVAAEEPEPFVADTPTAIVADPALDEALELQLREGLLDGPAAIQLSDPCLLKGALGGDDHSSATGPQVVDELHAAPAVEHREVRADGLHGFFNDHRRRFSF